MENPLSAFAKIKAFVFDVDGVMTAGTVLVGEGGELMRTVSIRDGYAVQLAVKLGYRVAIITGGNSAGIRKRFSKLGVTDYYSGVKQKKEVYVAYLERHGLAKDEVLYMGDDIPDYEVMQITGLATAPADACPEILAVSHYVSGQKGGEGCVRDVIERVLKLNGSWPVA
jgi:3-deoxy-D-manno-octulosonate 8-phosphate phosphatase (KDO 8-P phosphatase)